jgi:hypothetical protein
VPQISKFKSGGASVRERISSAAAMKVSKPLIFVRLETNRIRFFAFLEDLGGAFGSLITFGI